MLGGKMGTSTRIHLGKEGMTPVPSALPAYLEPILEQLISGAPDVTASRRLGMSSRTFSRRVAELLEYLGVQTRFQGGVEAARRGWTPPGPGCDPERRVTARGWHDWER
jgi:hypothetical protein